MGPLKALDLLRKSVGKLSGAGVAAGKGAVDRLPSRLKRFSGKDSLMELATGAPIDQWKGLGARAVPLGAVAGLGTGALVYDMAGDPFGQFEKDLGAALSQSRLERYTAARFAEERKRAMESLGNLASVDPHLYNEVLSGRKLPQGAMVFGGKPRTDLLELLGLEMARGTFQPPPDPTQELNSILGVA